ncbi:MAG: hypothetical protein AMXMBFR84_22720 [Candidatus Hydrogenedentota bacterium]
MRVMSVVLLSFLAALPVALAGNSVQGMYLESRSCDVFTGPCYANSEVGLAGTEAILSWTVSQGTWNGEKLDGLTVIAVVRASNTLGSTYANALPAKAVLITDAKANEAQQEALAAMATTLGGDLVKDVISVTSADISAAYSCCEKKGCAEIKAEGLVEVSTRCLGNGDHICGNESAFYPPLTAIENALPVFTNVASYQGDGLDMKWTNADKRGAFLGRFSLGS